MAGISDNEVRRLGQVTIPLGIAFQIQDDILNISADADTYGKDFCGDLWEGKHTLILIHALRTARHDERLRALEILRKPQPLVRHMTGSSMHDSHVKSQEDILFIRDLIDSCHSLAYAKKVANKYAYYYQRNLQRVSKTWPPSVHRDFLHEVAEFTVKRGR